MSTEFKLPEVAEGVDAADIAAVHVSEGDVIEAGQVVVEVETEKAAVDIDCPHAGRVAKVHISSGDTVNVGQVLLTIEESATEEAAAPQEKAPPQEERPKQERPKEERPPEAGAEERPRVTTSQAEPEAEAVPAAREKAEEAKAKRDAGPSRAQPAATGVDREEHTTATAAPTTIARAREDHEPHVPVPAGPSTRRMARQLGVDLSRVEGSGPGGRITAEDVQTFVRSLTTGAPLDVTAPMAAPALPDFGKFGPVERKPLNKIAKVSAANLSQSWRLVPHVTQHDLADITDLEAARRGFMQGVGKNGPKITMTAIVIKASVAALRAFPQFNSSLDAGAGELILKRYYHVGVAVDTEAGLLVPVIRDADQKSILEIAAELTELAERARERRLGMDEMQGATFTITNLGGIGGTFFTPIVNYPEVAILGMSRTVRQLQLMNGKPEERLMLPLSLSYDHRVVNGADAARFIVRLSGTLSDVVQLMIQC